MIESSMVEYAYAAPEAAPPPATPDFTSMQGYQRPAPQGIDADRSRSDARARGAGMRIVDLEYDWNPFHEDLNLTWSSDLGGTQFPRYTGFADEHGTAVFGELVADQNTFGVTGGVPDAAMFGISPIQRLSSGGTSYRPAASLTHLSTILTRGDTVLIEQQTVGPNGGSRYVPLEWIQSVFDAFVLLNSRGIVVVETGANGGENLDAANFQGRFNRSVRDSGAIIVGAGSSTDHSRLSFSSYGSRMDLQGWGHNITTTGSNGNLQGGTTPANINIRYTRSFGGTSGAGPIVTGTVVAVQSLLRATGRPFMTATQVSNLLKSTGTPQGGNTAQRIGPLPNLRAALTTVGG
jgi:subtilisin family serine protease